MLPEDIQDLIMAIILLIVLAVFVPFLAFSGKTYSSQTIELDDDTQMFLINYLKTETGDGQIADLIILNENSDFQTLIPLQTISKKIINFYDFGNRNYILKVGYPNGKVNFITASRSWDLPTSLASGGEPTDEQKKKWFELGNGAKIQIPSLRSGLIIVELEVENE